MATSVDEPAGDNPVLRPLTVETPEGDLEDLRTRARPRRRPDGHSGHLLVRSGGRRRSVARCAASDDAGARALCQQTGLDRASAVPRLDGAPTITHRDGHERS
jgi:hypothetical protein